MEIEERKEINEKAEQVHQVVFGGYTDYENLEHFLELRGIDVRYVDSEEIDGYLRWDRKANCPVIAVSVTNEAPVRRRFTMAHELGHLILDWDWEIEENNSEKEENLSKEDYLNIYAYRGKGYYTDEERKQEARANEFAAAFLIPVKKLEPIIDRAEEINQSGESLVNEVAADFETSTATAQNRIVNYLKYIRN